MQPPANEVFDRNSVVGTIFGPFVIAKRFIVISIITTPTAPAEDVGQYELDVSFDGGATFSPVTTLAGNAGGIVLDAQGAGQVAFLIQLKAVAVPANQTREIVQLDNVGDPFLFPAGGGGGGGGITTVEDHGNPEPPRSAINFTGAGVTVTDDGMNNRTNIDIPAGGSAHIIQNHGVDLPQEPRISFEGDGVVATDDSGTNRTLVTVAGPHIIQNDSGDLPQEPRLKFTGSVTVTDVPGPNVTQVDVSGGHVINDHGTPEPKRTNLDFEGAGVVVSDGPGDVTTITVNGPQVIEDHGSTITQRPKLDFEGAGVVVTDNGSDTTIVTIPGAHVINDHGTPEPQRDNLDFEGSAVQVADDSGGDRSVITIDAYTTVEDHGSAETKRPILDFEGTGVTVADDAGNNRTIVTVTPPTAGHVIEDHGTPVTQRANLNFTGGISVADDSGGNATVINVSSVGHNIQDDTPTTFPTEPNLQFVGPDISDDPGNTRTVVDMTMIDVVGPTYCGPETKHPGVEGYLTGIPASVLAGIGYVDKGIGKRGVFHYIDDFIFDVKNQNIDSASAGTYTDISHYTAFLFSPTPTVNPVYAPNPYASGAALIQVGNGVGPSIGDAVTVFNRSPAFSYATDGANGAGLGTGMWFTSRIALYYSPVSWAAVGVFDIDNPPARAPWNPSHFINGDGAGDFTDVATGLYFWKAPGDTDWTFYAVKKIDNVTPPLVTSVPAVTGHDITVSTTFSILAFRTNRLGDLTIFSDDNLVATIAHTDPTLTAMAEAFNPARKNVLWAVQANIQNFVGLLIDNLLLAQESQPDLD